MDTGLARVTIRAPRRRVDVALPEHVPLAELLPEILRHAAEEHAADGQGGENLADRGERHGGWVLRRGDGAALDPALDLRHQGVHDGEVLHLRPAHEEWPEPEYDDVAEAVAGISRRRDGVWTVATTRTAALAIAGLPLLAGLIALVTTDPRGSGAGWLGLGLAALLTLAAATASFTYGDTLAGVVLGGWSMPYAFAGGAALMASYRYAGVPPGAAPRLFPEAVPALFPGAAALLPGTGWVSGPELLAGSAALLLAASLAGAVTRSPIFPAGVTVGLLGALAAGVSTVSGPAAGAAALLAVLVCGASALPVLALRLGRIPLPPTTLPTGVASAETRFFVDDPAFADDPAFTGDPSYGDPSYGEDPGGRGRAGESWLAAAVRRRPERAEIAAAVRRTEELLAGMLWAHALLTAVAALVLARAGTWPARILLAAAATALLLRARLFITRRHRLPLLAGGLSAAAACAGSLIAGTGAAVRPAVTGAGVLLALLLVAAGVTRPARSPSPHLGRVADVLDVTATLAVIPVACAVAGLYAVLGGLNS
ncbi:type VII secretion integral membrane protein EccD [Actinoplanes sp. NPDC051851]|uniref:type VII secretion integral membrane protein EccD n=1 Tax=Actinoplanes sp. NPDC051851 TaxID=3154753 RepID=UPI00343F376A